MTVTLELELPEGLGLDERELKWKIAARLFDEGTLSSGQAAALVGVSKRDFLFGVGAHGVSVFQYGIEEIIEESERGVGA